MVQPMPDPQPLNPEAAAAIAKVRRLMLIAGATTFIALAFVLAVIGYRLFQSGERAQLTATAEALPPLPAGAKVLSSAVGDGRLVLTVDTGSQIELRTYDLDTLKPLNRARLGP
jgi:hypothetical protein